MSAPVTGGGIDTQETGIVGWHQPAHGISDRRSNTTQSPCAPGTKATRIFEALRRGSLNRFEAEVIGDHALNSTVAVLRARGVPVVGHWESVPTRFGKPAHVKRYSIPKEEHVQALQKRGHES